MTVDRLMGMLDQSSDLRSAIQEHRAAGEGPAE